MSELETISTESMETITGGASDPCSYQQILRRCSRVRHPLAKLACIGWEAWRCRAPRPQSGGDTSSTTSGSTAGAATDAAAGGAE